MLSTTCLSSLIYPWLLTCPLWCWAPRLTVTQTTSSSGKITAISPSKHIVFWTGREITVVVHMDDFGLLLGTIKTQFVEGPSIECRRAKVKEIETANRSERKYRWANENSNLERANCPNRGKTRLAKSRLVLVLNGLIWKVVRVFCTNHRNPNNPGWLPTLNWKLFCYLALALV